MKRFIPPSPVSGGLFLSYKCNASCKHCMYASSPRWTPDWISSEDLDRILTILAEKIKAGPYGPETVSLHHGLHFTGGEPFLNFPLLLEAVQKARRLGIPSIFAETNAFWCRHYDEGEEMMRQLKKAGLSGLMISVNPFVLESVPFERSVKAVTLGSNVFGQNLMVYQIDSYLQFRDFKIHGRLSLSDYRKKINLDDALKNLELLPLGKVGYTLPDWFPAFSAREFFGGNCSRELQQEYHNHWDNYGNAIPGFCAGIALGNLLEQPALYHEGLDLDRDYPLLKLLLADGVEGLYHFARSEFGYQDAEGGYISKCHLCLDLRRHIVSQNPEFKEFRPLEFYSQLPAPRSSGRRVP